MTTDELKALGLDDGAAQKVFALNGKSVEKYKAAAATAKAELVAAQQQISTLQDAAKVYEGVDVKGLQEQVETLQAKYDSDTAALRRSHALEQALTATHRARDAKSVLAHIDQGALEWDGDTPKNLEDVLKPISENHNYLFLPEEEVGEKQSNVRINSGKTHSEKFANSALSLEDAIKARYEAQGVK